MADTKRIRRLTDIDLHESAMVARLKLDSVEQSRLCDLGLRCGASVKILQFSQTEPLLVAVGDGRIAINYDTAKGIYVY